MAGEAQTPYRPHQPTDVVARRTTDRVYRVTDAAFELAVNHAVVVLVWPIAGSIA